MKKTMCTLLLMAMFVSLFAGCGGNTNTADVPSSAASVSERASAEQETVSGVYDSEETAEKTEPTYHLPISEETLTYSMWTTYAPFAANLVDTETLKGILILGQHRIMQKSRKCDIIKL